MISNLSQLKRALSSGAMFEIVSHYAKPEFIGQIRKPNKILTTGLYSIVYNDIHNPLNLANNGLGIWLEYRKASDWEFMNGLCTHYCDGRPVFTIKVLE